jgi:hypothetical protein
VKKWTNDFHSPGLERPLAGNAPDSLRREALWRASEGYLRTWGSLAQTVRSGEPGFEHVFGEPFFDYLGHNAQLAEVFNDVMTESSETTMRTQLSTATTSGGITKLSMLAVVVVLCWAQS